MADAAYQALIDALRMIPPDKRRELVDRALEEITEIEWREALKRQYKGYRRIYLSWDAAPWHASEQAAPTFCNGD
jgi:Mor family transcriptional regulator